MYPRTLPLSLNSKMLCNTPSQFYVLLKPSRHSIKKQKNNVYFWERQSVSGGGAETEGDTESEAGSRLWAVSTEHDMGLQPMNHEIMTWTKVRHLTNWATQEPQELILSYWDTGKIGQETSKTERLELFMWSWTIYLTSLNFWSLMQTMNIILFTL